MFSFLSLTVALTFLTYCLIEGSEISCERIEDWEFPFLGFKGQQCLMDGTTQINSTGFTITSPRRFEQMVIVFTQNKKIFYLPTNVDEVFPALTWYRAFDCSIKSVTKENFMNLIKLIYLDLGSNRIERIESNTFDDLTSMKYLYLSE